MQGPGGAGHPFRSASPPPVTIEPPDPFEEAFTRQIRRRKAVMRVLTGLFVAVPVLPCTYAFGRSTFHRLHYKVTHPEREISAEQKGAIAAQLDTANMRARDESAALAAGVRTAYADKLVARPDLGVCPYHLREPVRPSTYRQGYGTYGTYGTYGSYSSSGLPWMRASAPFPFMKVLSSDVRGLGTNTALGATLPLAAVSSPSAEAILSEASSLDARSKVRFRESDPSARILSEARGLASKKLDHDVILVVDRYREPHGTPHQGFTSGYVGGTAFIWDFASRTVACAARVHAFNSENVQYEYRAPTYAPGSGGTVELAAALRKDLEVETIAAVARALKFRAGPRLEGTPDVDVADLLEDLGL